MVEGKTSPGQFIPWNRLRAHVWGWMIDAGLERGMRRPLTDPTLARDPPRDKLFLKNTSGGTLDRGRVLEIGANLITSWTDDEEIWLTGSTPVPDGTKEIAVLRYPANSNDIVECCASGLVRAKVVINHAQHVYADVDSASTLLQSKWHGRAKIIDRESGTGEKWALVRLGEMFRGPIKGVAASGLARGSNATVTVYWAGAAASPSSTVQVYWNWMDGGSSDVPSNGELLFGWAADEQKYFLWNAECAHA